MQTKTKDILIYIIVATIPATAYGLFAFFVIYRWLAGGNMLYSYLWNIVFIIALLVWDKYAINTLHAKEFKITKENYFMSSAMFMLSTISFRTALYLFYIAVLVASRFAILSPGSIPPEIQDFVLSVEYCLILLVVFDKFFAYLMEDGIRIQKISTKFEAFTSYVASKRRKKKRR